MRIVIGFLALCATALASPASPQPAQGVRLTIDQIVKDDHIKGAVTGLTDVGRANFKIVVYVKTDKWYVHPYEQGGEGKSFALIDAKGTWSIETVYRGFSASSVAIVLVKRDARLPAQTMNVREMTNEAIMVRELEGTPDYGKL